MKNNDIRNAWDRILPDEAAEQRMLHRIQEYRAARGQKKRLKPVWIPAAVGALAAVALAVWGGSALRRMNEKLPAANPSRDPTVTVTAPSSTETEPVSTETAPAPTETEPVPTETEPVPTETTTISTKRGSSATAIETHRPTEPTVPPTSQPTAPPTQPTATEETRPTETQPTPSTGPTGLECPPAPPEPPHITDDFSYTFENGDVLRFHKGGSAGEPALGNDYQVLVVSGTELKKQMPFLKSVSSGFGRFHRETGTLDRLRFSSVDGMCLCLGRHGVRAANVHKPNGADSRVQGVSVRAGYFTTWDSQAWYGGGFWNPPSDSNDLYTVHFYAAFTLGETEIYAGWSGPVKDCKEMSGRLAEFVWALIGNGEPDMDAIHFNSYTGE